LRIVSQEPEGTRRRDRLGVGVRADAQRERLMAQQRMVEPDRVGDAQLIGG
jgi:hypothetical protein